MFPAVAFGATLASAMLYLSGVQANLAPAISAAVACVLPMPFHFCAHSMLLRRSGAASGTFVRYGLASAAGCLVGIGLVEFFWRALLAPPVAAVILSLFPAVFVNCLCLRRLAFEQTRGGVRRRVLSQPRLTAVANVTSIALAFLTVYLAVATMLLYSHPTLFGDDWRHYWHYFFERGWIESIFGRENGHLMIVPNILFFSNYALLGGRTLFTSFANVVLLAAGAAVIAAVVNRGVRIHGVQPLLRTACVAVAASLVFVLGSPTNQFWAMGVHNHAAALGAVGAAFFASGLGGRISGLPIFLAFVACALFAGTSFSTGIAAWGLGFAAALAVREGRGTVSAYLLAGFAGAFLTSGLGVSRDLASGNGLPALDDLLLAIPGFVGLAPGQFLTQGAVYLTAGASLDASLGVADSTAQAWPDLRRSVLPAVSSVVGAIGLVGYAGLTARVLRLRRPGCGARNGLDGAYLFFWLLCGFVLLAGGLVILGRLTQFGTVLYARFATWSMVFFWALIAACILGVAGAAGRKGFGERLASMTVLGIAAVAFAVNCLTIDYKLRYMQSTDMDRLLQIAVNGAERPTADPVGLGNLGIVCADGDCPEALQTADALGGEVQRIIGHMRRNHVSVYSEAWPHRRGWRLPAADRPQGRCAVSFAVSPTRRTDEWVVRGRMSPANGMSSIRTIYFVRDGDGEVVGFGKPVFGNAQARGSRPAHPAGDLPRPDRLLRLLPFPRLDRLPGVSGHFLGRVRMSGEGPRTVSGVLAVIGEDITGKRCIAVR